MMQEVTHLVVGGGVTGLAFAAFSKDKDYLLLEADSSLGGYCKTVRKDGFVWDYSGHFFHFKHPDIEAWLRERMCGQEVRTVAKRSFIAYGGLHIDFPFQKNIHQLAKDEFIDCLHDLYVARALTASRPETSFRDMLYARFGKGIAERFLIPYNEKLYACDLATLDKSAMGRFFPHADLTDVIRNMRTPDNTSYNTTFTYPEGGAMEYVHALASEVDRTKVALDEPLVALDLCKRIAETGKRRIRYERLVSTMPLPRLLAMTGLEHDAGAFAWNKVLVFNLGFDKKGPSEPHWVYFPDRERVFYRVGFYDNIFHADRMSLYVEIGLARDAVIDTDAMLARVLEGLRLEGIVTDQRVVATHSVVMDPAYVHITGRSLEEHARVGRALRAHGVYSIGRYGGWTFCSIEDNLVEARELAQDFELS